ncbi:MULTISPECIES: CGNR zinc finger domain-containing protein [Brevibacterium]|uniref:CGNR zinc finger domain-containing protein n=1 Tax=Brevibacterium TaxID=1696 RepID=UPI0015F05763|nr:MULTISPECIES: ABATE domain-containing protein [Brevibacterium]
MNDWLWYGGEVCLDFVNTLRDRYGPARETLVEPVDLSRWIDAAGLGTTEVPGQRELDSALRLRAAISRLLEAADETTDDDLDLINGVIGAGVTAPRLERGPQGAPVVVRPVVTVDSALSLIALNALDVLERGRPQRIRTCAHDRCGLVFYDSSRAGSRRWCSMDRCGNRAKAARHAARTAGDAGDDAPAGTVTAGG